MACSWTECNECGYQITNAYLEECPKCGSKNVEAEYDPSDWEESEDEEN